MSTPEIVIHALEIASITQRHDVPTPPTQIAREHHTLTFGYDITQPSVVKIELACNIPGQPQNPRAWTLQLSVLEAIIHQNFQLRTPSIDVTSLGLLKSRRQLAFTLRGDGSNGGSLWMDINVTWRSAANFLDAVHFRLSNSDMDDELRQILAAG